MAKSEHLEILKSGVEEWNEWRKENRDIRPSLREADLRGADLRAADLRGANLHGANLIRANLTEARLIRANLTEARLIKANLTEANLTEARLNRADLIEANLTEANLTEADLRAADLRGARLIEARLIEARLIEARLIKARLIKADLIKADLSRAILSRADLSGADLSGAIFNSTIIAFTDLTDCNGLEALEHRGPSPIEERTTKLDYKNLPKEFLKGCGLTKWQIEAIKLNDPDLNENQITDIVYEVDRLRNISPIQLYSLFISYSRKDEPFVEHIEKIFKAKDIRYWRDVHHMAAGPVEKQIDKAIRVNETVLIILSENSVESDWVEWEIEKARELEKKLKRHVICPVALDDSWKGAPWSAVMMNQVKKYNILDFSEWKNEEVFNNQYAKLLKGLNIYYRKKDD